MKRSFMFMDQRNEHTQKVHTTQSNIWIQSIPIKIPKKFFTELENNPKIHAEIQKILICQSNLNRYKAGGITVSGFNTFFRDTIAKTELHKNKKTHVDQIEENKTPRSKSMHLQQTHL